MDQVKFFKGCLPQILLSPFLNTLTQMSLKSAYETLLKKQQQKTVAIES